MNEEVDTREIALIKAVGGLVKKRLQQTKPAPASITFPPPEVHNHNEINVPAPRVEITNEVEGPEITVPVPEVKVLVDMSPVADAIRERDELLSQLLRNLAELLVVLSKPIPIEISPTMTAPNITLNPRVTVESPKREKRRIVIQHDDGTKSVLTEE